MKRSIPILRVERLLLWRLIIAWTVYMFVMSGIWNFCFQSDNLNYHVILGLESKSQVVFQWGIHSKYPGIREDLPLDHFVTAVSIGHIDVCVCVCVFLEANQKVNRKKKGGRDLTKGTPFQPDYVYSVLHKMHSSLTVRVSVCRMVLWLYRHGIVMMLCKVWMSQLL